MSTVQHTAINLIRLLSFISAFAVIVAAYNFAGIVLAAGSITGIIAWLLQLVAAYAVISLGLTSVVYTATDWFLSGIYKVFYDTAQE